MALREKHYLGSLRSVFFYELGRAVVLVIGIAVFRYRAYHAGRVPRRGGLLLVCNHQSFLDPPLVGVCVPHRHLDFLARVGLFRSRLLGMVLRMLHSLPIRQDQPDSVAMKETLRRLEQGAAVLIFPEGSRSPDGAMHDFKRGVALLVQRSSCPVLPCAITGAYEAWPRGRLPRLTGNRVGVIYGRPIAHDELMAHGPRAAVERLEREVAALLTELRRLEAGRAGQRRPSESAAFQR